MKTYIKLVRPDYGSFYDPSFKWRKSGVIEVPDAAPNGACGAGLHLARSMKDALRYAKFPFRILNVRPVSEVLGEDDAKIRVSRAEVLGEKPVPAWAKKLEKRIGGISEEMKAVPWFAGTEDHKKVETLVRSHFKLLVPFGFKVNWKLELVTDRVEAGRAFGEGRDAAWEAAGNAARDAAWTAAWEAAWTAAWEAAGDAAWTAAREAAREAAWEAAGEAAGTAARDAAREAAWDASPIKKPNPFRPLLAIWKLGAWPIGFVGDVFKVYVGDAAPPSKRRKSK